MDAVANPGSDVVTTGAIAIPADRNSMIRAEVAGDGDADYFLIV